MYAVVPLGNYSLNVLICACACATQNGESGNFLIHTPDSPHAETLSKSEARGKAQN